MRSERGSVKRYFFIPWCQNFNESFNFLQNSSCWLWAVSSIIVMSLMQNSIEDFFERAASESDWIFSLTSSLASSIKAFSWPLCLDPNMHLQQMSEIQVLQYTSCLYSGWSMQVVGCLNTAGALLKETSSAGKTLWRRNILLLLWTFQQNWQRYSWQSPQ